MSFVQFLFETLDLVIETIVEFLEGLDLRFLALVLDIHLLNLAN